MAAATMSSQLVDVVFETLRAHVNDMTPEQQISFSERVLASITSTPSANSPASSRVSPDPATPTKRRRKSSKPRKDRRKPVNAFMAFRAYISPILGKIPQKERSPMLSLMWRAEKRQGQFHLLGDAYSKIRDECSTCPSLDKFLNMAADVVSIIPANRYFELTGWAVIDDGETTSLRSVNTDDTDIIAAYPLQTNTSAAEIIQYCFDRGLINHLPLSDTNAIHPRASMSFAALPQNHDLVDALATMIPDQQESNTVEDETDEFFDFNNASASTAYNPSIDVVTRDQQTTYDNTPAAAHWSPSVQPPILGFDPNIVQGEFDPFSFGVNTFANM